MNEEPIKVCSKCAAEYALEATVCADCGGNLVFLQEHEALSNPQEAAEAGILIRQSVRNYLEELSELLRKSGIQSDIRFHGCEPGT
ncbi:MAG: hypothetical protein OEO21_01500 [Candidatus Krumholzibacteria bacterium]|nr:hypothetical protein [Candidatus Krumholzibacteria bacterium]